MRPSIKTMVVVLTLASVASAQGVINTFAGGGPNQVAAVSANVNHPVGVAFDSVGNMYVVASNAARVYKIDSSGQLTIYAGNGAAGFAGDGGPAVRASLNQPWAIAFDSHDNLFISDTGNNRIRRVDGATQVITTFAGSGTSGFSGDGGLATSAQFQDTRGVAVNAAGDVFIADLNNHRVRRVDAATGVITTIAGSGATGLFSGAFSGDGGPATSARLNQPYALAFDAAGNLYVNDRSNRRIRKIASGTNIITTVAGNGTGGFGGDGGLATLALLSNPDQLAVDSAGNLLIADTFNHRVRKVNVSTGIINSIAGNGAATYGGDGGTALSASMQHPRGLALDSTGQLYVGDSSNFRVRKVDLTQKISTVAGNGTTGFGGDGSLASGASLLNPLAVFIAPNGDAYIGDYANKRVRRIDVVSGIISTVAGNGNPGFSGDGGPATSASVDGPGGLAMDLSGRLLISDFNNLRVRRVDLGTGIISTLPGSTGIVPVGIAVDNAGNVVVTDVSGRKIWRIDSTGTATVVAGTGSTCSPSTASCGDGGAATTASLGNPQGLALDAAGNVFFADASLHRIRRIDAVTGIITTVAGTGTAGSAGNGGPATSATLSTPTGVALDTAGNLFIAEVNSTFIRRIDGGTGVISVYAGSTVFGFGGDGGSALLAKLANPRAVALDAAGNLYIADQSNNRIRIVDPMNPTPVLSSISPASRVSGGTAFTLTANGTSFVPSSVVQFGGSARPTTFVNSTQLLASIPASDLVAAGNYPITVLTPVPGGGLSNSLNFQVQRTSSLAITCSPSFSIPINSPTTCTATVTDTGSGPGTAPTGIVAAWFETHGLPGSFSPSSCAVAPINSTQSSCSVTYTPGINPGSNGYQLSGTYSGDHGNSTATASITPVRRTESTAVSCSPNPVIAGNSTTCLVTVTDTDIPTAVTPTGTVSLTSSQITGSFSPAPNCVLSGSGAVATCSVSYSQTAIASATISANHSPISPVTTNDRNHTGSSGSAILSIVSPDSTPPVITPAITGTLGTNGWYTSNVQVSWAVADAESTVSSTSDCGPTSVATDTAGVTFTCTATSAGGTASQSVTIKRDATPPTASVGSRLPNANSFGWNNTDVNVTFAGTDNLSGIAFCTAPVTVGAEGASQSASGTCTDNAGNTSATASSTGINIDKTAPVITFAGQAPAPNSAGWNNSSVTVNWNCTDALSGVVSTSTAQALSSEGSSQPATGTCSDLAGNSASDTYGGVNIDKTAPSVSCGAADGAWHGNDVSIACTASDALSGMASSGDAAFSLNTSVPAATETANAATGSRTVCDAAGNCAVAGPIAGNLVDKKAPSISGSRAPAANAFGWNNSDVTVSFACTDGGSGLAAGSPPANAVLSSEGAGQSVNGTCTDAVGNSASASITGVNIDKTPPSVNGTPSRAADSNGWYNHALNITWSGTDPLSGVDSCSAASAYSGPDSSSATASGSCTDHAGNTGSASRMFSYDSTPPVITLTTPTSGGAYVLNSSIPASFACADSTAGMATCSGTVPNGSNIATNSVGGKSFSVTATDLAGNSATSNRSYSVIYGGGGMCYGDAGHQILQPVNVDGTSVFKQKSTVPAKFRVCDANGNSIGAAGVVVSFNLVQTISGTVVSVVNEPVDPTTPDGAFRWSSTDQQWIFNISTKPLSSNVTYVYRITLNDGSYIDFRYGLK